jgi:hypothetical protein
VFTPPQIDLCARRCAQRGSWPCWNAGSVLRQAEQRLEEYWATNYAQPAMEGKASGPWERAVEVVVELMHDMLVRHPCTPF